MFFTSMVVLGFDKKPAYGGPSKQLGQRLMMCRWHLFPLGRNFARGRPLRDLLVLFHLLAHRCRRVTIGVPIGRQ